MCHCVNSMYRFCIPVSHASVYFPQKICFLKEIFFCSVWLVCTAVLVFFAGLSPESSHSSCLQHQHVWHVYYSVCSKLQCRRWQSRGQRSHPVFAQHKSHVIWWSCWCCTERSSFHIRLCMNCAHSWSSLMSNVLTTDVKKNANFKNNRKCTICCCPCPHLQSMDTSITVYSVNECQL